MAINIGSNFSYNGSLFLDNRQSFDTLAEMRAFSPTSLPEGFITYCKEDQKRYEFKNGEWVEFTVSGGSGNASAYFGNEEPEDEEVIWFTDSTTSVSSGLDYDNPLIAELFACIRTLQDQVKQLQADVEYLKMNGGGGIPEWPDMPDNPEVEEDVFLTLEDGGLFLLEDGGFILLEEAVITPPSQLKESVILLESGGKVLFEDGSNILLERQEL